MWTQPQLIQLFCRNSDPGLINRGIQFGLAAKTRRRGRGANEIQDRFVTVQGMPGPIGTNQVEHPMLNQIPFGSTRRIMGDGNRAVQF